MKGKIKSIFVHIINGIMLLGLSLVITISYDGVDWSKITDKETITCLVSSISLIALLVAEIILIVYQAKHKFGKAPFITGLIANSCLVLSGIAVAVVLGFKTTTKTRFSTIGLVVTAIGVIGLVLYILINKDNKGAVAAPAKAVEAKKEEVAEDKPEVIKKEPVVTEKKPVAVAKKPAAAKKPAPAKKAPAKKAAPKKVAAKKPVAKKPAAKKPATKKPAAKKKK